jgi:hypothetical protein
LAPFSTRALLGYESDRVAVSIEARRVELVRQTSPVAKSLPQVVHRGAGKLDIEVTIRASAAAVLAGGGRAA